MTAFHLENFLHAGQRAYLGYGLWSTRAKEPAGGTPDLPPLDAARSRICMVTTGIGSPRKGSTNRSEMGRAGHASRLLRAPTEVGP